MSVGRVSLGSVVVRVLVCGLMLGGLHTGAQGSALRVASMGGLSICLRDLDNDPVAFNPARATSIERRTVEVGGAIYSYNAASHSYNSQLSGGNTIGSYSNYQYTRDHFIYDILGYIPLNTSLVTGLHVYGGTVKYDSLQVTGQFNAADTLLNSNQQSSDEPSLTLDLLAAKKFAPLNAGLQVLYHVPYTSHPGTKSRAINNGFAGPADYDFSNITETETVSTYSYDFKAGVLLSPWEKSSIDITLNPVAYDSKSRQTVSIVQNADVWTDDLNVYPRTTVKFRSVTGQANFCYDVSPRFSYGFQVRCTPASSTSELQRSTYTFTTEKSDGLSYVLGAGIGFKTPQLFEAGLEVLYYNNYAQYHSFAWGGSSAGETLATESRNDRYEVKIGMEQWIIENKLAVRLGGLKYIASSSSSRRTSTMANALAASDSSSYNPWMDLFSAGGEWVFNKDLSLEYGLVASGGNYAQHEINMRFLF